MAAPDVRKQSPYVELTKEEYRTRFFARFYDPAFDEVAGELEKVFEKAWDGYHVYRKSPRQEPAGPGFADPSMRVPSEWLRTRAAIQSAEARQKDPASKSRILIVNGSTRSEHTCPGEISKTRRLAEAAQAAIAAIPDFEVDFLDLSTLADEPLKEIYPCKACVSTAQPLCHWPCSCYPNHALGQSSDWMAEIYPRWSAAHGVMVLCPVHWYQAPASLKLMIDRLVCADGGNADFTSTGGKDPAKAKQIELAGWEYPKHLAGRAFSVVVHGDAAGPENLRRNLVDWLTDIGMVSAGPSAQLDTWIGWYEPYATSHAALDEDTDLFIEVAQAAGALANLVTQIRAGKYHAPDEGLKAPREK